MANTEGTSSSIPSTSNPSNNRPSQGRGGHFYPPGRQEGPSSAENQYAGPPMNPRGGYRGSRGNNRGRGQQGAPVGNFPYGPSYNFAAHTFNPNAHTFNPNAPTFNPSASNFNRNMPMPGNPSMPRSYPVVDMFQPPAPLMGAALAPPANQDARRGQSNSRKGSGQQREQRPNNQGNQPENRGPNNRGQNNRRGGDNQNQQQRNQQNQQQRNQQNQQQRNQLNQQQQRNQANHQQRNQQNQQQLRNQPNQQQRPQAPSNRQGNRRGQGTRNREQGEDQLTEEEMQRLADKPLREKLIWQLENGKYECAICYRQVCPRQGVWSCKTCYHIFHISNGCITDWARSSRDKEGANTWRCPTCQTENDTMPYNYFCFCGRQKNPTFRVGETPHSCGEICGRARKFECPHPCTELCHPGPCVECQQYTTKTCNCGKTKKSVRCGTGKEVKCDTVCGKMLSCQNHACEQICHSGECQPCTHSVKQDCFCDRSVREVQCYPGVKDKYPCEIECDGMFDCEVHRCNRKCHSNGCGECETAVNKIRTCPCGRHNLEELNAIRKKCTDKVATCDAVCDKWLSCGTPGKNHHCQEKCHEGPCPPCTLNTSVVCRCGNSKEVIPCDEYLDIMRNTGEYLCTKRCRKKKSCGMHKCQEVCCIFDEHFCTQTCNKRLSCGIHTCENVCHAGLCPPCLNASFDEQFCHCGTTVRMPPIPCGAALPPCPQPCARPHSCDHPVTHKCHSMQSCPPCIQLVDKLCYGGHMLRKNIPCHMDSVSCGVICQRPLKCGVHVCQRSCHGDECEKEGVKCVKKCEVIREQCEHPCALPCHEDSPCEPSPCKTKVKVTCECGRIKKEAQCFEVDKMIQAKLEKEEEKKKEGETSGEEQGKLKRSASLSQLNCFKCDEECKKLERNRRVADALEVEIDEYGMNKLSPTISFPCYLKDMVKNNIEFVKSIEKVFCDLIIEVVGFQGEAYSETFRHHLPPMSIKQRRFVHEYAHFFQITSESVDQPPKRSIILTATRGKSHQPMVLISDLVNFKGALKTPGPAVIRKDIFEKTLSRKEEEEGLMKPLRCTERMVVRREARPAKEIAAPIPIKQTNQFTLLGSDVDSDDEGESSSKEVPTTSAQSSPPKDWWDDEAKEEGWKKVQQKEYTVHYERDMTEEEIAAAKQKEEGPTWEDQAETEAPAETVDEPVVEDTSESQKKEPSDETRTSD